MNIIVVATVMNVFVNFISITSFINYFVKFIKVTAATTIKKFANYYYSPALFVISSFLEIKSL